MALTQDQINIVKSTVPILQQHGKTITTTMYRNMLHDNPSLKNYFSLRAQHTGQQPAALANAVLAYATHIDELDKLTHAVERIAQKHVSLYIQPEQYAVVGKYLVAAFGEVLGEALTDEVRDAWVAAYGQLADVFIHREAQIYEDTGRWKTWRKFSIVRKEMENETVASFYLEPLDGEPLPSFLPGQYVSLQIPITVEGGEEFQQSRQFSLSESPKEPIKYYRVSVKKEGTLADATPQELAAGKAPGLVSNILHEKYTVGDVVELSAPAGEFFVDPKVPSDKPLVLISGGVGATPMAAILDATLASPSSKRPISWIHTARHSGNACFTKKIRDAVSSHPNVKATIFLKQTREADVKGVAYDFEGRMANERLSEEDLLPLNEAGAEYYICGPETWMIELRAWLLEKGVGAERIHLELFGTGDV